ncbi:peptide ABC transporter permease [Micromonospora arborensis]|uniref:Peptide ABC transporter permease n=2 Tax=Micromonospora arborensis TaxID=2116518 RepID=A0A318NE28_9ACTN|nr:ABC transporter permease [Micromonospora arborensis]PYC63415.1 peptide ABC transporter permease [Micromonospora arborensis]
MSGRTRRSWSPATLAAVATLVTIVLAAVWPELLTHRAPDPTDLGATLQPPNGEHLFGTDRLGRDVYSRVVHGARLSLLIGLGATALGLSLGTLLGVFAGAGGRWADGVTMRLIDVLFAVPELLVALLAIAVFGSGTANVVIAIGLASAPSYARLIRSQVLTVRESEFVQAARTVGRHPLHLIVRHVMPNTLGPVLALAAVSAGGAVVAGSALSYLGLGPPPPAPDWGSMLADGQSFLQTAWWLVLFPGLAIAAVVISASVVGRSLRTRST